VIDTTKNIPRHVAIIMDGNGRWARKRNLPRTEGHRQGVKVVERIIEAAIENGVKVLTLYAFSTENWNRPRMEVKVLFELLHSFLKKKLDTLLEGGVQLHTIGEIEKFPARLKDLLRQTEQDTKKNSKLILNLALNYGSRAEILSAVRAVSRMVEQKKLDAAHIDEKTFANFLYTDGLPDPDLLIRTSGEMRISNFMLWQLSYAELYFCNTLWPDFSKDDFKEAIAEFQRRERRFGGVDAVKTSR